MLALTIWYFSAKRRAPVVRRMFIVTAVSGFHETRRTYKIKRGHVKFVEKRMKIRPKANALSKRLNVKYKIRLRQT